MIARIWHGRTKADDIERYAKYVRRSGIEAQKRVDGCLGSYVLTRTEGDVSHIQVISLWDSMAAVMRFAGSEPEKAVYFPEDEKYLLELEPHVLHYEVELAP